MAENKGRRQKGRYGRWLIALLGMLMLGTLGYGLWEMGSALHHEWCPVRFVRVEGSIQNLEIDKFRETLTPAVMTGYFSMDLGEIEGVARSFAWVEGVQVTRQWPDTLVLSISEHVPAARWGEKALLDVKGQRFAPDRVEGFEHLPALVGPSGMEHYLLDALRQIDDKLAPHGLSVASLSLSKRRAWTLRLVNGLEMHFGRREPIGALDRFLGLVGKLGSDRLAQLLRVDLRYPNGFAVVWRPEAAGELTPAQGPKEPATEFQLLDKATVVALEKQ